MTTDIVYLLRLGLTVEQVATRAGTTVTAVRRELEKEAERVQG